MSSLPWIKLVSGETRNFSDVCSYHKSMHVFLSVTCVENENNVRNDEITMTSVLT